MEIILFILLVGVWAAYVLPSFMNSRREISVNSTTQPGVGGGATPIGAAQLFSYNLWIAGGLPLGA